MVCCLRMRLLRGCAPTRAAREQQQAHQSRQQPSGQHVSAHRGLPCEQCVSALGGSMQCCIAAACYRTGQMSVVAQGVFPAAMQRAVLGPSRDIPIVASTCIALCKNISIMLPAFHVAVCAAGKAPAAKKAATGSGAKPKAKPAAKKGGVKAPKRTGDSASASWRLWGLGYCQELCRLGGSQPAAKRPC